MNIDLDRTDIGARSAQGGGKGQIAVLFQVDAWRKDGTDRSGDGVTVAMAAAAPVDGAGVHTGAAADALQRITEVFPAQLHRTAVVDDDNVHFAPFLGPLVMGSKNGHRLTGGAAAEQAGEDAQVLGFWGDLFDAHAVDLHRRQVNAHVGVALVGAHDYAARFRHGEVHARNSGLADQKLGPKVLASGFREVLRILGALFGTQLLVEKFAHILLFQVDGRQHDVAGRFFPELDDAFAQVGIHDFDALFDQVFVQMAFFGEHGFALDHALHVVFFENAVHDLVVFLRVFGPVDGHAVLAGVGFEFFQVLIQVGKYIVLDLGGDLPKFFPLGERPGGIIPFLADEPKGLIVPVGAGFVLDKFGGLFGVIHI